MAHRLPDSWSNWNLELLAFEEGRGGRGKEYLVEKISQSNGENQQQTPPTYGVDAGIWTRITLLGGECSLTEPPFLPYILIIVNMIVPLFKTLIGGPALVCELTHISI